MYRSPIERVRNYRSTFSHVLTTAALFCAIAIGLFYLINHAYFQTKTAIKDNLIKDLRFLLSSLDFDEKLTLSDNKILMQPGKRDIAPLLLPRQYYNFSYPRKQDIPFINKRMRPPPRNCFIQLERTDGNTPFHKQATSPDLFCSYFTNDFTAGRHLFFNFIFSDSELIALDGNRSQKTADAFKLKLTIEEVELTWWIYFQAPVYEDNTWLYQISAFKIDSNSKLIFDKSIEGWAKLSTMKGNSLNVSVNARIPISRIFEKNGLNLKKNDWPPEGTEKLKIAIERKDASQANANSETIQYLEAGRGLWTFSEIGDFLLAPEVKGQYARRYDLAKPVEYSDFYAHTQDYILSIPGIFKINSDWQLQTSRADIAVEELLEGTDLVIRLMHPGPSFANAIWITTLALILIVLVCFWLVIWGYINLAWPILSLSRAISRLHKSQLIEVNGGLTKVTFDEESSKKSRLESWLNRGIAYFVETLERYQSKSILAPTILPFTDLANEIGSLSRETLQMVNINEARIFHALAELEDEKSSLYYINHDIRGALNRLMNPTELLTDKMRHQLLQQVEYVLNFWCAEIVAQTEQMNLAKIDINGFMSDTCARAKNGGLNILFEGSDGPLVCLIDRNALTIALEKILDNATEYGFPGSRILIAVDNVEAHAILSVTNHGPNIADDRLMKVFSRFETSHVGTKRGIGLFTSRIYIKRMGGTISASNSGKYSVTFNISIPLFR